MAGTGAAGTTAKQIAHVLHLPSPSTSAFGSIGRLQAKIAAEQAAAAHGDAEAPQLNLADGLFLQEGFPAAAPFLASLTQNFAAAPQTVNFSKDPGGAVQRINEWVSRNTGGLIPSILSKVSENARLILANAVYLHAFWASQFKKNDVSPGTFHGSGAPSQVPFMHQTREAAVRRSEGLPGRRAALPLLNALADGHPARWTEPRCAATRPERPGS